MKKESLLLAACVASLSAQGMAQSSREQKAIEWHVDGGYSSTIDRTANYLDNGWIVGAGVTWRPEQGPFALELAGHYSEYDATNQLIDIGTAATQTRIDDGDASTLGLDLNGVFDFPVGPRLRGYIKAGVGIDRRRIELTQTALFNGFVCDVWWGLCGVLAVPGDVVVSRDSVTRFAWNGGFGLQYPLSRSVLFLDASYHRIETRRPTEYVPITIGIRF